MPHPFKIGFEVVKKSGKPFKSTRKVGTIAGFKVNEQDPKKMMAAMFEEDDSLVSVDKLKLK